MSLTRPALILPTWRNRRVTDHATHLEILRTQWGVPDRLEFEATYRWRFERDQIPDLVRLFPLLGLVGRALAPMMAGFGGFPAPNGSDFWLQTSSSAIVSNNRDWATYSPPEQARILMLIALGSGAGGSGGTSGVSTTTTRSGGGGGGSAGCGRGIFPAPLLPPTLYASVGQPGAGGAPGSNGGSGTATAWSTYGTERSVPPIGAMLLRSGSVDPTGGGRPTAGGGGTTSSAAEGCAMGLGVTNFTVGDPGYAGGTGVTGSVGTSGGALHIGALPCTGGAGGGGTGTTDVGFAGGGLPVGTELHPGINGGAGSNAGAADPGQGGYGTIFGGSDGPGWQSTGGGGGGSSGQSTGGRGGAAGPGSGGGGGGAGVTAGVGADGGIGLALAIAC